MNLFEHAAQNDPALMPLAERLRPRRLDEVVGQAHLLGPGQVLPGLVSRGRLPSAILWGPPGSGKTTLGRILAGSVGAHFESLSAVLGGVKELRTAVERAQGARARGGRRTVLFVDEIHRFNKGQQDALLPHVEAGVVTLIGATTENPSFEVNAALLSRCRVFVLRALGDAELSGLLEHALADTERGLGALALTLAPPALRLIISHSAGDARRALTTLEVAASLCQAAGASIIDVAHVEQAAQHKALPYDKDGEAHHDHISAFIKSMRGSDPDAALYYMARMLESGEAPHFILRRMVIFASEDIGNADPVALRVAIDALAAFDFVGLPEGTLPMTQAVLYLACAPKSNAVIAARDAAKAAVQAHGALPVPQPLRNAPTALARREGAGKGYQYPHDHPGHHVRTPYLPEALRGQHFYTPSDQGHERAVAARLAALWHEKGTS